MKGVNYGQGSNVVRFTLGEMGERKGMNSVHKELSVDYRALSFDPLNIAQVFHAPTELKPWYVSPRLHLQQSHTP